MATDTIYGMRVRYKILGGHTHLRIFVGKVLAGGTLGKAGDLIMTNEEFEAWKNKQLKIEFLPEEQVKSA